MGDMGFGYLDGPLCSNALLQLVSREGTALPTCRLFGDDEDRVASVGGVAVETEDWGGSSLDDHHSFIVQYRPTDDKRRDGTPFDVCTKVGVPVWMALVGVAGWWVAVLARLLWVLVVILLGTHD